MTVTRVRAGTYQVSYAAQVNAPARELFNLLTDPTRHPEVDGSGSVREHIYGPASLTIGDRFSMKMRMFGVTYRITSIVTAVERDRLIEWRHPFGHRWRWEFAACGEQPNALQAPTMVTESFDYSAAPRLLAPLYTWLGMASRNADGIEDTLRRLQRRYPATDLDARL